MLSNNEIKQQLNLELEKAISQLKASDLNDSLRAGLKALLNFNFNKYKENLKSEIKRNLRTIWTNHENGINRDQKLDAILFEYQVADSINLKAIGYGIIDWNEKEVDNVDVDMGYDYDFADGFEQVEGITLNFFDSYLDSLESDQDFRLADCYRLKGTIAVHEIFWELHQENEFEKINKNDEFYFLLGEHDSICYAVLSIK